MFRLARLVTNDVSGLLQNLLVHPRAIAMEINDWAHKDLTEAPNPGVHLLRGRRRATWCGRNNLKNRRFFCPQQAGLTMPNPFRTARSLFCRPRAGKLKIYKGKPGTERRTVSELGSKSGLPFRHHFCRAAEADPHMTVSILFFCKEQIVSNWRCVRFCEPGFAG